MGMSTLRVFWKPIATTLLIVLLIVSTSFYCAHRAKQGRDVARVDSQLSQSRTASAGEAAVIQDKARNEAGASEQLSRDNANVIQAAPGADVRLSPDLNRAALERVCRRAAAARRPECLQFAGSAQP
jgi:hypothetical protein